MLKKYQDACSVVVDACRAEDTQLQKNGKKFRAGITLARLTELAYHISMVGRSKWKICYTENTTASNDYPS